MMDFDSIQNALDRLGATADAAETHGTLCGLLLDNSGLSIWLGHTLEELPDKADVLAIEQLQLLEQLFEDTREQLNIEDLSFSLLLPDDCRLFWHIRRHHRAVAGGADGGLCRH